LTPLDAEFTLRLVSEGVEIVLTTKEAAFVLSLVDLVVVENPEDRSPLWSMWRVVRDRLNTMMESDGSTLSLTDDEALALELLLQQTWRGWQPVRKRKDRQLSDQLLQLAQRVRGGIVASSEDADLIVSEDDTEKAIRAFIQINETMCVGNLLEMNEDPNFDPEEHPAAYWRGMLALGRALTTLLDSNLGPAGSPRKP
jgi:hypothetical protein